MRTNDILAKFQSNNNKLETVLAKKSFSGDVKNLLLSMQYNISSSYNDYANIKINVESKNKFIEDIIEIIDSCENIELVRPSTEEGLDFMKREITSEVDTLKKSIKVFPTEKAMLFALFKMNDTKMYLDEKYNLIRTALPEMLNEGRDINKIEIIRDFNAWSWNTLPSEIRSKECNLIYQNLLILLGFDFFDNWMKLENQKDTMEKLEEKLKAEYNEETVNNLLNLIYKISIIICTERNKKEKQRLLDEKEWDEKEFERLNDKKKLVAELTKTKKEKAKEIERIDKMINDEILLAMEFEKRNESLPQYKKIYSVQSLLGTVKKERKKALAEIDECNKLLDAKTYIKRKEEIENNLDLLNEVNNSKNKEKYNIELQKIFIDCLEQKAKKIEKEEQKRELIQLFKVIRYYNFIVYDEERFIKDVKALSEHIDDIEYKLIKKLYDFKAINSITKDIQIDIKIIKPIFYSRIMNLDNVYISAKSIEKKLKINVYDGNVQEFDFELENTKGIKSKGKKIRLFGK